MTLLYSPGCAAVAGRVRDIAALLGDVTAVAGGADALTDDICLVIASASDTALVARARALNVSVEIVTEAKHG